MSTEAFFEAALPFVVKTGRAAKWQLVDSSWENAAQGIVNIVEDPTRLPDDAYYKNELRRLIFRFPPVDGYPELVVKGFPLGEWRHRIRYKKYAYSEARNLIMAKQRGLPVPRVLGPAALHDLGYRTYSNRRDARGVLTVQYLVAGFPDDVLFGSFQLLQ